MEKLYTVKEVANIIKTNVDYVYKLIKSGVLPAITLGSLKVREKSLNEFIERYEGYDLSDPYKIKENEK